MIKERLRSSKERIDSTIIANEKFTKNVTQTQVVVITIISIGRSRPGQQTMLWCKPL